MEDLREGYLYYIDARNACYGIWIPEHKSFMISRVKFGDNFVFEENHWDCEEFATAKPLKEIEKSPFTLKHSFEGEGTAYIQYKYESEILSYLNKFENGN